MATLQVTISLNADANISTLVGSFGHPNVNHEIHFIISYDWFDSGTEVKLDLEVLV